jgi:hypothetical protein
MLTHGIADLIAFWSQYGKQILIETGIMMFIMDSPFIGWLIYKRIKHKSWRWE